MNLLELAAAAQAYLAPKDIDCVVYHHPCKDGVASAIAVSMSKKEGVTYVPFDQRTKFDVNNPALAAKNVAFLDCAPSPEDYDALTSKGSKLLVLDHHKAAMDKLTGKDGCFSMPEREESGVSLTWAYLFGDAPMPDLFRLIRDRDTFQNKLAESEALYFMLDKEHPRLGLEEVAQYLDDTKLEAGLARGAALVQQQRELINRLSAEAQHGTLYLPSGKTCPVVFAKVPDWSITSPLGAALYGANPSVAIVMEHPHKEGDKQVFKQYWRSAASGPNVSEIAKEFVFAGKAGGGSAQASGSVWDQSVASVFTPDVKPSPLTTMFSSQAALGAAALAAGVAGATVVSMTLSSPTPKAPRPDGA